MESCLQESLEPVREQFPDERTNESEKDEADESLEEPGIVCHGIQCDIEGPAKSANPISLGAICSNATSGRKMNGILGCGVEKSRLPHLRTGLSRARVGVQASAELYAIARTAVIAKNGLAEREFVAAVAVLHAAPPKIG